MICKWCGAPVTAGDKKCGRCGREIPALSDCGGFYDLVPNPAAGAVPVAMPAVPAAPPPDPEELSRRAAAKKRAERMALIRLGVLAVVALAIVVMLIVLMVRVSSLDKQLDAAQSERALLDSKLSAHLEDAKEPESPFQDMGGKPGVEPGRPEDVPGGNIQPVPPPDTELKIPESWGFSVAELGDNGRGFISNMNNGDTIDTELRVDAQQAEGGICFVDPAQDGSGQILVVPGELEGSYTLEIHISGGLVQNYKEFRDEVKNDDGEPELKIAKCTPDGEGVTVQDCRLTEEADGVIYTMEVPEEIHRFFAKIAEDKGDTGILCVFTVAEVDENQTIYVSFQPAAPDAGEKPMDSADGKVDVPVEGTETV